MGVASKYRPSMDPMHPSVHMGGSIIAMVVPYRFSSGANSHMARPHPTCSPTPAIVRWTY